MRRSDFTAGRGAIAVLGRAPAVLWILLAFGIALRVALWSAHSPAVLTLADAGVYADLAGGDLFEGAGARSVGYPVFLRAVHSLSSQLEVTIAVQHLIGILAALVLYGALRRLGTPVWVGAIAAAAILLTLDQIFLEHALMTEAVFTLLFVLMIYAAVRALDAPRPVAGRLSSRHAWIAAAAATLALAGWVRPAALPLILPLALWFVLAIPGPWRARLANAALAVGAAAVVVLSYFALNAAETGYFGLSRASGWALYSRTAPFADCTRFDPPAGTRPLCETTPVDERPGPDFYAHEPDSPARQLFGVPPQGNDELGTFGRRVILAQPLSYMADVGRDFVRYFHPAFQPQDFSGVGYDLLDLDRRAPGVEEAVAEDLNAYYADDRFSVDVEGPLSDVQDVVRAHPKLLLISLILGLAGLFVARNRLRSGLALLLGASLGIMLVTPATAIWSARYAVPAQGPMLAAGAIGAWLVGSRLLRGAKPAPETSAMSPRYPGAERG